MLEDDIQVCGGMCHAAIISVEWLCQPYIGDAYNEGLFTLSSAMVQTSAAGVLALLSEPEAIFKQHALKALNPLVPQFWAEISEHIALMWVLILSIEIFVQYSIFLLQRSFI